MTISKVEPDLRQIIQNLRDGDLEKAKDRTVELIESAFRMSGPMYREETMRSGSQLEPPAYNRAAGKLRILPRTCGMFLSQCGVARRQNALGMAERALAVFLKPEAVARTLVPSPRPGGASLESRLVTWEHPRSLTSRSRREGWCLLAAAGEGAILAEWSGPGR